MTDALMGQGRDGAEVLAVMMGAVFDPLVEAIFGQGGQITGIAGDSISALYPADDDAAEAARRALASAAAIQKALASRSVFETPYGGFRISARIGLGSGAASWGILRSRAGDTATYYFRGDAVEEAARAEGHALPGETLLSERIRHQLGALVETEQQGDLHLLKKTASDLPAMQPVKLPDIDLEPASAFVPAQVLTQNLRGEFRQTVDLFVRIAGPKEPDLEEFAGTVLELRGRYGGLIDRIDYGDKGCSLMIVWGAPTANENDIDRALGFILDLQKESRIPLSAGMTYYTSHAGYVGSRLFEAYTAYGWGANLAARFMMSAAENEVWLDERIYQRMRERYRADFVAEQSFKGFAQKQKVYVLRGRKSGPEAFFHGKMVGREAALELLTEFMAPLWEGKYAGVAGIWGEAGMGKSRLVYEFRRSAAMAAKTCLWAVCQCDEIVRRSLNPFRYWLARYFEVAADEPQAARLEKFVRRLDELAAAVGKSELAGDLKRGRTFLAGLIDLEWPDALADQLDAQGRYDNTILALMSLLKAESLRRPLIMVVEDAQYLDEDSKAFVPRLKRALAADPIPHPIAILMTTRWQGTKVLMEEDLVDRHVELDALDPQSLSELCRDFLNGPANSSLIHLIQERSEGNPFFTEQTLRLLQEQDLLERDVAGEWGIKDAAAARPIPTDIRTMLLARLDTLPGQVKEVIQAASVLGRAFEIPVLSRMVESGNLLQDGVSAAEAAAIWSPLSGSRYIFNHALLREMAYQMQLQSRREELHARAYTALKEHYGADARHHYADLAYHSEQAKLKGEARRCLVLAGDAARDEYQNAQALDLYQRALALIPQEEQAERYRLHRECEKIVTELGRLPEQTREIEALAALAEAMGQPGEKAEVILLRSQLAGSTGDYGKSEELAERARELALGADRSDILVGAYTSLVHACYRRGLYKEAIEHGERGVKAARQKDAAPEEATFLNMLGLAFLDMKNPSTARTYFEQSLTLFRSQRQMRGIARVLSNLGLVAGYQGNYTAALEAHEQALRIAREIGERSVEGIQLGNIGWISGLLGNYPKAQAHVGQALQIAREVGDRYSETFWLINLSSYAAALGESDAAIEHAEQSLTLARQSQDRSAEAWALTYLGHGHFELGRLELARRAYSEALAIRKELEQAVLATEPAAGLAQTSCLQGDRPTAEAQVASVLSQLEQDGTLEGTDQPLRVYLNCYLVLDELKDGRAAGILNRARDMLRTRANGIADPAVRRVFLEGVTYNREILSLWQSRHPAA